MQNSNNFERQNEKGGSPDGRIFRQIGSTEYQINVFFNRESKETMSDKIKRMIKNEAS